MSFDEMLKNVEGQINIKKLMKKAQKDPRLFAQISNLQKTLSINQGVSSDTSITPQQRAREKIKQLKMRRVGLNGLKNMTTETKPKTKDSVNVVVPDTSEVIRDTVDVAKLQKTKKDRKLKKLQKKYGTITIERWSEALKTVEQMGDNPLNLDQLNHAKNIIALYNLQTENLPEKTFDLGNVSDSDDELDDIDQK